MWRYRELLAGLVRKELKVKYKDSVLGFAWSLLNPMMYLVVFYVVFQLVLKSGIPSFAIYLLSGLLVWTLFANALAAGTGAVVDNAAIVKKVAFPREILVLAAVGANLVHFFLQITVLIGAMLVTGYAPGWSYLPLLPVALLVLLVFTSGLAILLSAINVYLRDTKHLLELTLTAWFWMTPIVYQYRLMSDQLAEKAPLLRLNPMTSIVLVFQRALYNQVEPRVGTGTLPILPDAPVSWHLMNLLLVGGASVLLFVIAMRVFSRAEGNFAEEI